MEPTSKSTTNPDEFRRIEYEHGNLYLLIEETPSGWDGFLAVNTFPAISVNDQPGMLECLDLLICKMCELIEDAKLVERHLEGLFAVQFQKERGK